MSTEAQLRKEYVETARSFLGVKQGSMKHKKIIVLFNTVRPDGWSMTYTAPWCATFASAMGIKAFGSKNAEMIFPLSASCPTIINKARAMRLWKESDSYKPTRGDWILYDWDDDGKGDNVGSPDHVGIVESIVNGYIKVIEGNKHKEVGERSIPINSRYIRGFVVPKYSRIARKHTNAWYFRRELKKILKYANDHNFKYVKEYSKCGRTWEEAKVLKRMNCQMFISYALQNAGFLKKGQSFYCTDNDRIKCQGGLKRKDLEKIATITHPHKGPKKLKMKKGDICGYGAPYGNPHTMEYDGMKKGVPSWYSWGSSDVGDKQPKYKDSYTDRKISTRIRLK